MSVIPPEGFTRWIFGPGTGPDGSGQPMRFIWPDFQAKRLVLDPFGIKFDALYYSRRGFFSAKMVTLGFDKPCCC